MLKRKILITIFISVPGVFLNIVFAQQPAWTIDLLNKEKKPEKFENRKLGSEKMAEKKFTKTRQLFQNNFTHYNYYYNANNKIKAVIERAKLAQKDDFTNLLTFYPYTLDNTAAQSSELDSVLLKVTAGILLHDLRNDWIDNMYLLMGKAYFLRKDFDSAASTFQFINYNLFPRKKKDDDENRIVGTNDASSNSTISIANKEKQNLLQKIASQPPSRNDALVWLARTLVEQEEYGEAAGLINTLQVDPNLPNRLRNDLEEVNAYLFFRQNIYDSATVHLERALSNADTKQDQSRSEFLLGQLYEITHHYDKAANYYAIAAKHTTNPLMNIYALLNIAKLFKGSNPKELDNSIINLLHMTKKDKFEAYRDILYYSAGELALQKTDSNLAASYYLKSLQYNETNTTLKNKSFIQLGDIAYSRKQYKMAFSFYDSLQTGDTSMSENLVRAEKRRNGLSKIVEKIFYIEKEDSLQKIAAMTEIEREIFMKKLVKRLRKERGLKEEDNNAGAVPITFDNNKEQQPIDLFTSSSKGEWYFYNASLKSKGYREFKSKWGSRTNIDNWRRKAAMETKISNPANFADMNPDAVDEPIDSTKKNVTETIIQPEDISYVGLMSTIPLTEEKLKASHAVLSSNLFELAKLYQNDLEDYEQAIETYNESLKRYPDSLYNGELYLGLYYCYNKLGNLTQAAYYKNLLTSKFPESRFSKMLTNPAEVSSDTKNSEATKKYEAIYNLFIEGKFEEALSEKKIADSLFSKNYWSAQLLYIEAVYHIKQRNDSIAKTVLNDIIKLYPASPLKPKAERLISVLDRRTEIETYLSALQVTRQEDQAIDSAKEKINNQLPGNIKQVAATDSNKTIITPAAPINKDSAKKVVVPVPVSGPFTLNAAAPHHVIMVLDKVDPTYVNESKSAFTRFNSEKFSSKSITVTKDALDNDHALLVFGSFTNADDALIYYDKIKKAATDEVSWLPASKYSFLIITDANLQLLKVNKDVTGYKNILNAQYPEGFEKVSVKNKKYEIRNKE